MNHLQHPNSCVLIPDPENPANQILFSGNEPASVQHPQKSVSINYVQNGPLEYQFGFRTFQVNSQELLLMNSRECSNRPNPALSIHLDPNYIANIQRVQQTSLAQNLAQPGRSSSTPFEVFEHVSPVQDSPLHPIINQIIQFKNTQPDPEEIPLLFFQISEGVLSHEQSIRKLIDRIASAKKSTREELFRRLLIAQDFMRANFTKKIAIKQVAKAACLSEYHFIRTFKQCFQKTPVQFIKGLRLDSAKKYLLSDHYTVSEVATLCGFADIFYFSLSFKKAFNQSPTQYRQSKAN